MSHPTRRLARRAAVASLIVESIALLLIARILIIAMGNIFKTDGV
jgi:hypothetical protein